MKAGSHLQTQLAFASTKSFWLTMFEAFYNSTIELIDTVTIDILLKFIGSAECREKVRVKRGTLFAFGLLFSLNAFLNSLLLPHS